MLLTSAICVKRQMEDRIQQACDWRLPLQETMLSPEDGAGRQAALFSSNRGHAPHKECTEAVAENATLMHVACTPLHGHLLQPAGGE